MSGSVFTDQPEFIDTDPRTQRPDQVAYRIDADFMRTRHEILLPGVSLEDRTVLDLGSCNGATGAWVLAHGAKSYTGVEFQPGYANQSKENLARYYPADRWTIHLASVEEFLLKNREKYDVIVALGVVHAFADVMGFLNAIAGRSRIIVIDGTHPRTISRSAYLGSETKHRFMETPDYVRFIENEPFLAMEKTGMSLQSRQTVFYDGYTPSMGFVIQALKQASFDCIAGVNEKLKQQLPGVYSPAKKFGLCFAKVKGKAKGARGLLQNIASNTELPSLDWKVK